MARLLRWEGGFVDDPKDPGGATKYGISLRWLKEKGIDIDGDGKIDAADVKALTTEKAGQLYEANFWRAAYSQIKDESLAIYVFDMAVNMGPERAHRIAQEAAGVESDGVLGPASVAALNAGDPLETLARMRALRCSFYKSLAVKHPALAKFLPGWLKRANEA